MTVRGNSLYDVEYVPDTEGPCKVDVTYAGQHVPNRCTRVFMMMIMMMTLAAEMTNGRQFEVRLNRD